MMIIPGTPLRADALDRPWLFAIYGSLVLHGRQAPGVIDIEILRGGQQQELGVETGNRE